MERVAWIQLTEKGIYWGYIGIMEKKMKATRFNWAYTSIYIYIHIYSHIYRG